MIRPNHSLARGSLVLGGLLLPCLLLLSAGRSAGATRAISFAEPVNYAVPNAGDVTSADFDGDQAVDIAVAHGTNGGTVSILYGNGDGTFQPAVDQQAGQNGYLSQVLGADVDGDGQTDLVVTDTNANRITVLLNQGQRTFAQAVGYGVGMLPYGVTAADFNGDGRADLAVSNHYSHNMCVLLNQGNGIFGAPVFYGGGSYPSRILSADFNRDGQADLAMGNYISGNVVVWLGNGAGGFTGAGGYGVDGQYPAQVVTADFTGDGLLDLATANTFSHSVSILAGNGLGGFSGPSVFPGNTYPHIMAAADLDQDGWIDLATPNNGTDYFTVLQNLGGNLDAPQSVTSGGTNVRTLTTGDFNADGKPDVAVGNESSGSVSVFLNTTGAPRPPGTNLIVNGSFEFPDVTSHLRTMQAGDGLAGWRITSGSIDLVDYYWPAAEGQQSADLGGNGPGRIEQRFPTEPGTEYELKLRYANNFDYTPQVNSANVLLDGVVVAELRHSSSTRENMDWTPFSLRFTATGIWTTLAFQDTTGGPWGIALDAVSVIVAPDNTPPSVASSVATAELWATNFELVNVGLTAVVRDDRDPNPTVQVRVFSDEGDAEGNEPGVNSPDAVDVALETLRLRAERSGTGDGRVYLIVVTATDAAGNIGFDCTTVVVPHDLSEARLASVRAQAAAAAQYCRQNGGAAPPGYQELGTAAPASP